MNSNNSKDRPLVQASLEGTESIVSILMHGEFLSGFPVLSQAINFCKALDSLRDRSLALKLARFIENLSGITEEQKNKLKEKVNAGTEEATKIGETLFFVIERVTDLDKPALLAKIFLAYVDEVISGEELRRLCQAVDTAFANDLQQLLAVESIPDNSNEMWMQNLLPSGLTRLVGAEMFDDLGKLYCEETLLAKKLRNAYFHSTRRMG